MEYIVNKNRYHFSYKELRELYIEFINLTDEAFFSNIPKLLHFISFVAFLKEIDTNTLLSDEGLLHELIHMLNGLEVTTSKEEVRSMFERLMLL